MRLYYITVNNEEHKFLFHNREIESMYAFRNGHRSLRSKMEDIRHTMAAVVRSEKL